MKGELYWIFTAITDTIAWNVLPRDLFQKLFRQDLLVAALFRNFLLAGRIMRAVNCTPVSYPPLPPTHQHPMWYVLARSLCPSSPLPRALPLSHPPPPPPPHLHRMRYIHSAPAPLSVIVHGYPHAIFFFCPSLLRP